MKRSCPADRSTYIHTGSRGAHVAATVRNAGTVWSCTAHNGYARVLVTAFRESSDDGKRLAACTCRRAEAIHGRRRSVAISLVSGAIQLEMVANRWAGGWGRWRKKQFANFSEPNGTSSHGAAAYRRGPYAIWEYAEASRLPHRDVGRGPEKRTSVLPPHTIGGVSRAMCIITRSLPELCCVSSLLPRLSFIRLHWTRHYAL